MFDGISSDYDKLNHIMSLNVDKTWRKRALRHILPEKPEGRLAVLDVACGTGDFSVSIARAMQTRSQAGKVTGVDLSEGMLEVMRRKIETLGLTELIEAEYADGEDLHFAPGSFDRVTVAFGIRNFEDRQKGLEQFYKVLKPGGKLIILELSVPSNFLLRGLYKLYFLHIMPWIGGLISGNKAAYKYLPASVLKFPKPEEFMESIRQAGFERVFSKAYTFGICRIYVAETGHFFQPAISSK